MASAEMSQDVSTKLFEKGAIIVMLNVPVNTEVGIDWHCWQTGPNFKGIKMIPPGIHFIYFSAVNKEGQRAPRTGFFYNFEEGELVAKEWSPSDEDFYTGTVVREDQKRLEQNKHELDRYLGVYPYDVYRKWISSTNFLTPELIGHLVPLSKKISSVTEFVSVGSNTQSRRAAAENVFESRVNNNAGGVDEKGLPIMLQRAGTELRFTTIPKQKHPEGASKEDITKYNLDHSFVLDSFLQTDLYKDRPSVSVLGELQFAFVCFILGQVYDGFEQWKLLVDMLCKCDQALVQYTDLYLSFINVMHYQAKEIPEDFFVDIVAGNNFLVSTLRTFFRNVENSDASDELKTKAHRFQVNLEKRFTWDFSGEDDDDQPIVVDNVSE